MNIAAGAGGSFLICRTHQAEDSSLEAQLADLKKMGGVLEHHLTGTKAAKTRFEAMVGN